jgi:hypothetical protein
MLIAALIILNFESLSGAFVRNDLITSAKGSFGIKVYINTFLIPLFKSLFLPSFSGPVSLFISPLFLSFLFLVLLRFNIYRNRILAILFVTIFQIIFSFILHTWFSQLLPSALRYNYFIIVILLFILFSGLEKFQSHKEVVIFIVGLFLWVLIFLVTKSGNSFEALYANYYDNEKFINNIKLILFLTSIIGIIIYFWYNKLNKIVIYFCALSTPFFIYSFNELTSLKYVDYGFHNVKSENLGKFVNNEGFSCINEAINKSEHYKETRSFIFVAPEFSPPDNISGRSDLALLFLERPDQLYGRTFGHWRYTVSSLQGNVSSKFTGSPINAWPATYQLGLGLYEYSKATFSPFLIAVGPGSVPNDYVLLQTCKNSGDFKNISSINNTLTGPVRVFYYPKYGTTFSKVMHADFKSSQATFLVDLSSPGRNFLLPIAYHPSLIVKDTNSNTYSLSNIGGYLNLFLADSYNEKKVIIKSQRIMGFLYIIAGLALILLIPSILSLYKKNNIK